MFTLELSHSMYAFVVLSSLDRKKHVFHLEKIKLNADNILLRNLFLKYCISARYDAILAQSQL